VTLTTTGPAGSNSQSATLKVTPAIGVDQVKTGKLNQTGKFTATGTFKRGNQVAVRVHGPNKSTAQDATGAGVGISITGPGVAHRFTGTTDSHGWAVVPWPTAKKTPRGTYSATVTNVAPADPGQSWDGVPTSTSFALK